MHKARAIARLWAWMLAGALMGVCGCGNVDSAHERRTDDCRPLEVSVTTAVAGQRVLVRVRATNVSSEPIAIVTMTHPTSRGEGAPFVYYGGTELVVLFWGHSRMPWGVFEDVPQNAVSLQQLAAGETYETEVALDDPLDERTAWGSLYNRSPANPEGVFREVCTLPVSRVLVVMAYYDWAEVRAFLETRDGHVRIDRRLYMHLSVAEELLSPEAYGRAIARKIEYHAVPFDGFVDAQEVQRTVTAGPVGLPRKLTLRASGIPLGIPVEAEGNEGEAP